MSDANHDQVVRMLREALEIAERKGAVGIDVCVLTADGSAYYRWHNLDGERWPGAIDSIVGGTG